MKRSVRFLTLVALAALLISLFAACGKSQGENLLAEEVTQMVEGVPENSKAEINSYPLVEEKATFTWFGGGEESLLAYIDDLDARVAWMAAEEITNVHIEFLATSNEAALNQFNVLLAANDLPDFVSFKYYFTGSGDEAVEEGYIYDLWEFEEYAPNFFAALSTIDDWEKLVVTDNGYLYQLSQIYDEAPAIDQGLSVRQDWLDELEMDTPVTYDDFYDMLMAFQVELGHSHALALPAPGSLRFNTLVGGYGIAGYWEMNTNAGAWNSVPFYQVDGVVHCGLLEDGMLEYVTMMNEWYEAGFISSDSYSWNQNSDSSDFETAIVNGEIGLWFCKIGQYSYLADLAVDENFEVRALADAVKEEGDIIHFNNTQEYEGARLWENGISITATCEEPELAVSYLDFFYTEEGGMLANYGVENISFEYDSDGVPHYTELITNNPDGMNSMTAKAAYLCDGGVGWKYNIKDDYTDSMLEAEEIWASNKDALYNFPKYMSLTADEQEMYNLLWADIKTYASERIMRFITGELDLNEWNTFVDTLVNDLSIQTMIDLTQAAYDRYQQR